MEPGPLAAPANEDSERLLSSLKKHTARFRMREFGRLFIEMSVTADTAEMEFVGMATTNVDLAPVLDTKAHIDCGNRQY